MKKIMELLQNMKAKNEKKDNKGFSLVELIIVIAIMAILVGIVGTQVIPYINKSRKAKDIQQLSALCTAATTAYSSNASVCTDASYTITINSSGVTVAPGTESDKLQNDFIDISKIKELSDLGFESTEGKAIETITIQCQDTAPMVSVSEDTGKFEKITSK